MIFRDPKATRAIDSQDDRSEVADFKKLYVQMGVALLSQKPINRVASGLSKGLQS